MIGVLILFNLISECNDFFKDSGFTYAFCGGYALEMYLNREIRTHSDIDIIVFEKDKKSVVEFIIKKGWNVYLRADMKLIKTINSDDKRLKDSLTVWAIKPNCSFIKLDPVDGEENTFTYKILSDIQLNFDFIDLFFNKEQDREFICNQDKHITRDLDLSIMYNNQIPYLSPEIKLFFDSKPRYMELDYFKTKNRTDFESTAPYLPKENRDWLIGALVKEYPDGHKWIEKLKNMDFT